MKPFFIRIFVILVALFVLSMSCILLMRFAWSGTWDRLFNPEFRWEKEMISGEYGDQFICKHRMWNNFPDPDYEHFLFYQKKRVFSVSGEHLDCLEIWGIANDLNGTIYKISLIADGEEWGHIYLIRRPGSDTFEKLTPNDPLYPSPSPRPSPTPLPTPVNLWPQYGGVPPSFAPKPS